MLEIYALLTLLQRDRAAMSDGTPAALVYRYLSEVTILVTIWIMNKTSRITT